MRLFWIIQVCLKSMTSVLKRAAEENAQIQRREGHVKSEAELGVMQLKPEESLEPPEAGRGMEGRLGSECGPADTSTLGFWLP